MCNVLFLIDKGAHLRIFIINLETMVIKKTTPQGRFKQTEFLKTHHETNGLRLAIRDVHRDFKTKA